MSEETTENGTPQTIPYDRFQKVVAARDELAGKVADYETQLQTASERAATADTLAAQVQEWSGKYERDIAYARAGLDEEGATVAEVFYGKLDGDDKPDRATWLKSMRESEDAPKALRAYFNAETPKEPETPEKPRKPRTPETPRSPGGAEGEVSVAEWQAAKLHGQKTGDWSQYKALKKRAGLTT